MQKKGWVAKDFKNGKREDLFAATPPLEALKLLLSLWMTEGVGFNSITGEEMKMEFIDVRRAYFHADAVRDMYVELPDEMKIWAKESDGYIWIPSLLTLPTGMIYPLNESGELKWVRK